MRSSQGKSAEITCGMVSPMTTQNANMPPNALPLGQQSGFVLGHLGARVPTHKDEDEGGRMRRERGTGTHNAHCAIYTVLATYLR